MTGLAAQIQLDESDFAFNSSGNIDVSGMLVSSRMIIDFLASKANPSEYIGFTMHPSLQEFYDFDAMGRSSESANIGYLKAVSKNSQIEEKKEEKKQDNIQNAIEEVFEDIQEKRIEQMQSKYGYDFDEQDFKKALRENLENWDEFSKGMEPDEADELHSLTILALTAEGDELKRIKERMDVLSSDRMEQTERRASEIRIERGQSLELSESSANAQSVDRVIDLETKIRDRLLEKPASQISSIFSSEVDGNGMNAQSFVLDDESKIAFAEKAPDAFVLDA